jgi:hypothetical protein
MKRRDFLKMGVMAAAGTAVAGGWLAWVPRARASTVSRTYYITEGTIGQPDGTSVYMRGFSDTPSGLNVPGTPFIVQEGDAVNITITNGLQQNHSFTIAGVVDSGPIAPGETTSLSFSAPSAGSYLYYDGLNAPYNRLIGLHGGMAVMPAGSTNQLYAGSPTFSQQYFWVFNDIDPAWNAAIQAGGTPTTVYTPRYFTINGQSSRPPGAPGNGDPAVDAMANPNTVLHGSVGERTLIRVFNAGLANQSVHWHANHVEWLTQNRQVRPAIWRKDVVPLANNMGAVDVIYPFEAPPDAYPAVTTGMYPMHLHNEMTQTAGGGLYLFGAMTDIHFV